MAKIDQKLREIDQLNTFQKRNQWMNRLHPLVKFTLGIFYIALVISVDKYRLDLMLALAVYPIFSCQIADLKVTNCLYRMRLVLPLVIAVGIFNPFFDKIPIGQLGPIMITTGMLSMLTLTLKGIYTVLAATVLISTTSIEEICYAMQLLHVPKVMVTVILLIYRYIFIMGEEASRIFNAYSLRAPSQKGLNYRVWGPLIGQWLLRSMDKAQIVYEAMALRGFKGSFAPTRVYHSNRTGLIYGVVWVLVLLVLRFTPLVTVLGSLFV